MCNFKFLYFSTNMGFLVWSIYHDLAVKYDPPLLKPFLINTILIGTFAKYYSELILKDTSEAYEGLKKLKLYFP